MGRGGGKRDRGDARAPRETRGRLGWRGASARRACAMSGLEMVESMYKDEVELNLTVSPVPWLESAGDIVTSTEAPGTSPLAPLPAGEAATLGSGCCCSRSKHRPFWSRTRTPARRMPIVSRSPGTSRSRWSTLVTLARRNVSPRLERLSISRKASTVCAVCTRPRSRSPYFAGRRSLPELSDIVTRSPAPKGRGAGAESGRASRRGARVGVHGADAAWGGARGAPRACVGPSGGAVGN